MYEYSVKIFRAVFFLFFCFPPNIISQPIKQIELINANSLEYNEAANEEYRRLIGNVVFKHDNVFLYCDSAHMYIDKNSIDAFGKVHIQQGDSINLYGKMLKYDGNNKIAQLYEDITFTDNKVVLTTQKLEYNLNTNNAIYRKGGKIVDDENILESQHGYYYANDKQFYFKEKVVLTNPQYIMYCDTLKYNTINKVAYFYGPTEIVSEESTIYCENGWYDTEKELSQFDENARILTKEQILKGDSLFYDRKNGLGKAFHNIEIKDTAQNIIINGQYAEYHQEKYNTKLNSIQKHYSFIVGKTLFTQIFEEDSLFLHADTLETSYDSAEVHRSFYGYYKAKIYKSDLQGSCDSIIYSTKDSTIKLYVEPIIWSGPNQLTADTIHIKLKHKVIDYLKLYNSSFIASQEDSLYFNQIKGKNMTGYFKDNELHKILVEGNGQTIYFGKDNQKIIGVNRADCSNMLIYVSDNKVDKITMINEPDATFYPIHEVNPKELLLKGFSWKIHRQPTKKEDIFIN